MRIAKAVNQYYGSYFEQAIASIINEVEVSNTTGFSFPKGHEAEIETDARSVVDKYFSDAKAAKHIGRETSSKSGDIIIDGVSYEIKYVSGGAGTHFNTSVSYTKNLGYISMVDFMRSEGLFKLAAENFGSKYSVNEKNISPVSNQVSSAIRKDPELASSYENYKKIEASTRAKYVKDFLNFLQENPEKAEQFIYQMVSKETANKEVSDVLIVFDHGKKTSISLSKEEILSKTDSSLGLKISGKNSISNGFVRATFSWQNGIGLNNPTIRVFI